MRSVSRRNERPGDGAARPDGPPGWTSGREFFEISLLFDSYSLSSQRPRQAKAVGEETGYRAGGDDHDFDGSESGDTS